MSQVLIKRYSLNILKLSKHSRIFSNACSSSNVILLNSNFSNQTKLFNSSANKAPLFLTTSFVKEKNLPFQASNFWSIQKSGFHSTRILREKNDDESKDSENSADQNQNQDPPNVLPIPSLVALAPLQVPEFLPKVPLVAIARNPLFPNFIKMLEISDKNLMDLIRRKVHLNQPYIGLFLRKEER